MKKIVFLSLSLLLCVSLWAQPKSENLFYMIDTPDSFESFEKNIKQISVVCPQTFKVSKEGTITGYLDKRVVKIAKANGVRVVPLIVNTTNGFDMDLLRSLVRNPESRARSIEMMVEYAKQYDVDGWQFDLEHLHMNDRDAFTRYYRETAEVFKEHNLELSAALMHLTDKVGGVGAYQKFLYEEWRGGFDLKALAEIGSFLSIMTYDQHTKRTTPGPVASPQWVERVIQYVLSQGVPAQKISMGIPTYSMHWFSDYTPEKGGFQNWRSVNYKGVMHTLAKEGVTPLWNEQAGCDYAVWDNDGTFDYLFIENAKSLEQKLPLLEKYKLRGISAWVLGSEDPELWSTLAKKTVRK